jgi:hypothetical protein
MEGASTSGGSPYEPAGSYGQPPSGGHVEQLTVGGILRVAFGLYRKQMANLWAIVALIVIPAQVLVWVIVRVSLSHPFAVNGTVYTSSSTFVPTVSIIVIGFVSAVLVMGALSKALGDAYAGYPSDWRQSLGFASDHLGPLIVLALLSGVLLALGYFLLVIPGIYLTVVWSVAVPVLVFERIGPVATLNRSPQLVSGRWWATFAVLLVGILLIVVLSFVIGVILSAVASSNSVTVVLLLSGISRAVSALVTYPILAALSVTIYMDLRARKEGFDPRELAQAPSAQPLPLS